MAHMVSASVSFVAMFILIQMVLFRHLRSHGDTTRYHRLAVKGVAFVAVMGLAWMYSAEAFDISHPGVQLPIHLRIIYTYILSGLGILFLGLWLHSDRTPNPNHIEEPPCFQES